MPRVRRFSLAVLIAAVIAGVLAGALGASAVLRQEARFASRSVLLIDQTNAIVAAAGEGPVVKLNALRTKYALLAKTRRVTAGVAQRTGFPEGAVAAAINITVPGPSLLMIVEARTNDPDRARVIADATAEELSALVRSEMEAAKIPEAERIVMSVVAPAQRGVKFEPSRGRAMTIGFISGLISLLGIVVIAETVRTVRRRR
jgi:capsular polysaccharide biosynthesis protein